MNFIWFLFLHCLSFIAVSSLTLPSVKRVLSRRSMSMMAEVHEKLLFVEAGFGCDQHGQNSTKAAIRACRNAIEFNSLCAIRELIPGGYENMKLKVQVAVPNHKEVDVNAIKDVFPYGEVIPVIEEGGLCANSGIQLDAMGDKNTDMLIAVAAIYVGY